MAGPMSSRRMAGRAPVTMTFVDDAAPWALRRETARVGSGPFDVTTADFSGDGYPDVAVANADSNSVSVLLYQPSPGTFTGEHSGDPAARPIIYTFATGAGPRGIAAADFTGDGKQDLAVSLYTGNKIEVYRGDGTGHFTLAGGSAVLGGNPQGIATGDIDHDGRIDLVVARNGGTVVTLLGDGTGNLGRRHDVGGSGAGRMPALADLDGNGTLDLALVGFGDTITVFSSVGPAPNAVLLAVRAAADDWPGGGQQPPRHRGRRHQPRRPSRPAHRQPRLERHRGDRRPGQRRLRRAGARAARPRRPGLARDRPRRLQP